LRGFLIEIQGMRVMMSEEGNMNSPVSLERAKQIIQYWYDEYCKVYEKQKIELQVEEDEEPSRNAYKVTNPENGASTSIFWSTVSDYDRFQGEGIPGDLIGIIWDSFNDLQ
jgi:hypothetical protein